MGGCFDVLTGIVDLAVKGEECCDQLDLSPTIQCSDSMLVLICVNALFISLCCVDGSLMMTRRI